MKHIIVASEFNQHASGFQGSNKYLHGTQEGRVDKHQYQSGSRESSNERERGCFGAPRGGYPNTAGARSLQPFSCLFCRHVKTYDTTEEGRKMDIARSLTEKSDQGPSDGNRGNN